MRVAVALGLLGAALQVPSPEAVPKATGMRVAGHGGPGAPGLSNSWTVCPSPSSHMARGCVAFTSTLVSHGDQREGTRGRESRPHSERGCFSQGPPTKADAAAPQSSVLRAGVKGVTQPRPTARVRGQAAGSLTWLLGWAPALAKQVSGNSPQVRNYRFISTIEANVT